MRRAEHTRSLYVSLDTADRAVEDLRELEPNSPVVRDYSRIWRPRIIRAIERGRCEANNFPWLWRAKGDDNYIRALQEILGPLGHPFTVGQGSTVFQRPYTMIIW